MSALDREVNRGVVGDVVDDGLDSDELLVSSVGLLAILTASTEVVGSLSELVSDVGDVAEFVGASICLSPIFWLILHFVQDEICVFNRS